MGNKISSASVSHGGDELDIPNSAYRGIRKIGGGAFGEVLLAESEKIVEGEKKPVKLQFAVKKINPAVVDISSTKEMIEKEKDSLKKVCDKIRFVPYYIDYFESEEFNKTKNCTVKTYWIVQEYVPGSNLETLAASNKFSEEQFIIFLQELLNILMLLHREHVYHRDIRPANIIKRVDLNRYCLVDFGLAIISASTYHLAVPAGTLLFMAPEAREGIYGPQSDLYSLGITVLALLEGGSNNLIANVKSDEELPKRSRALDISQIFFLSSYIC